jgi:hypothetical protein
MYPEHTGYTSHRWYGSWNTLPSCHVKLLAHVLFTTAHRFVYFGFQWNACNRPILKLHLSDTWLLSYQLRIPVITSAMFALWIYHFRIFVPFSLFLKPSAEWVLYTNFIVYCQFLLQSLHPPLSFPVLWRFHSLSVPLHIPTLQPHLRKSYFPFSPALMRCKPGEKFISGCSLDDPASGGKGDLISWACHFIAYSL